MAAKHERSDILHRHVEFIGQEMAEAARIEDAGHADHHMVWKAGKFAQGPYHRVERVGDADDKCVWRVGCDAFTDRLHHLQVDAKQIVAAHARLARDASGDDDDVSACDIGIIIGARDCGVEAFNRTALRQIQRLALRNAFNNVEKDDVAKAL